METVWRNVVALGGLHLASVISVWLIVSGQVKLATIFFAYILALISGYGTTIGAHRLWSHRSFCAHWSVRIVLIVLQTITCQNCLWTWARDHRMHHKFSDTDADPHNINRGFFFSHIGWLMTRKHSEIRRLGNAINMTDLNMDPIVMFQKRFYYPLALIFAILLPTWIPYALFDETLFNAFMIAVILRIVGVLNITWSVNSFAHSYGARPYNPNIAPTQNFIVSLLSSGEGWHNYHHVYPYDYRASEFGGISNGSKWIIDRLHDLNLVWDLRVRRPNVLDLPKPGCSSRTRPIINCLLPSGCNDNDDNKPASTTHLD